MPKTEIGLQKELRILRPGDIPHVLKEGALGAVLEWTVTDPTGKVIEHVVKKSESFVKQFLQLLFIQMGVLMTPQNVQDTGNVARGVFINYGSQGCWLFDVHAAATITDYGIVVGTGVVAPTISDFALGTLIAHGVGAGAMQYDALTFGAPGSDATTSQLTITRNFTANVGGITPTEIGLICRGWDGVVRYFLVIRDTIVGGIAVPAGSVLTINYRLQATV